MYTSEIKKNTSNFNDHFQHIASKLWESNYKINSKIEEKIKYETKHQEIDYICTLTMFKYEKKLFGLRIKKTKWTKPNNKSLSNIEELHSLLGRHSNDVVYLFDVNFELSSILNFKNLNEMWQYDKDLASHSFSGKPADIFIKKIDEVFQNPTEYLDLKKKSLPDGMVLQLMNLFFSEKNGNYFTFNISGFTEKLNQFTLTKQGKNWNGSSEKMIDKDVAIKVLKLSTKYELDNVEKIGVSQKSEISIKSKSKDSPWEEVVTKFSVKYKTEYEKTINLKISRI